MRWALTFLSIAFFCLIHGLQAQPLSRLRRNAYRNKSWLWPNAIVPYTFDEAYTDVERAMVERAMRDIHSVSCVRFKERKDEGAYVQIVKEDGCSAVVGYTGGRQKLILGEGCICVKTVLHELFHVLGFFHEHTRPDRDEYVTVNEANIKPAALIEFSKMSPLKVTTFGLPYDYLSIMHYHDRQFAIDSSQRTLELVQGVQGSIIGKASKLSKLDILKLNKLYSCPKRHEEEEDEGSVKEDVGSGRTELEDNFIFV